MSRVAAPGAAGCSGQVLAMALGALGWLAFMRGITGGLWLMAIGLFVAGAAAAERRWAELVTALCGVRVGQAMTSLVVTGPDWLTVDRFLSEVAAEARHSVLPLLDFDGRPSGVVRLHSLAAVPSARQASLCAREVATPLSWCTLAAPDELLNFVLERLGAGGVLSIPVMEDGRLRGIIPGRDIDRARRQPRAPSAPPRSRPPLQPPGSRGRHGIRPGPPRQPRD
ncbi:CBS domain-containing protein [Streptomyces sp. NPDC001982]|uniref:CBS domain-containing protein n=1 Tax=Streptomyces sp. NPDC001982 TaxID=3154405 RepID=UPI0033331AC4